MRLCSALLLTTSITLAGCQTTKIVSPQTTVQDENTRTMKADIPDSEGDGVLDDIDECLNTPSNVVVDKLGCPVTMDLMSLIAMEYRAFFSKGSSELLPKYQLELDKVAKQMNKYDTATMKIEAHASEDEIDQALSALPRHRAMMVKNYLILKHDIKPSRLSTFDCGARAPIAPTNTEEGKSFNHRVYGLVMEPKNRMVYQQPNGSESGTCIEF